MIPMSDKINDEAHRLGFTTEHTYKIRTFITKNNTLVNIILGVVLLLIKDNFFNYLFKFYKTRAK